MAEVWRGVVTPADIGWLGWPSPGIILRSPTQENWLKSGKILEEIRRDCGLTADELRDLHFDVLIALTARSMTPG
jgi:hypothetical protein